MEGEVDLQQEEMLVVKEEELPTVQPISEAGDVQDDPRDSRPPPSPRPRHGSRFHPYTFARRGEHDSTRPRDSFARDPTRPRNSFARDSFARDSFARDSTRDHAYSRKGPSKRLAKFWLHISIGFESSIPREKQTRFQESMRIFLAKPMQWVYANTDGSDPRNVIRIMWVALPDSNMYETEVVMDDSDASRIVNCKMQYNVQRACTYNNIDKRDVRVSCTVLKVL
jgi:hypothetical protein